MLAERDGVCVLLAGSITPDDRLAGRHNKDAVGPAPGNTAEYLLSLYLQYGSRGLEGLNGIYAAAVWDSPAERLIIITGRGGLEPLFYWHSNGRMVFASRLSGLRAHPGFPRDVNAVAVMDLLATGQLLDERTLFEHAYVLPPAARAIFERGELTIETYWRPPLYAEGEDAPEEPEAMRALAALTTTAVKRQLTGLEKSCAEAPFSAQGNRSFSLLLTGGLDSRLLAGILGRLEGTGAACAVTIGHDHARDVRYGRRIAEAAGLNYSMIPSNPRFLAEYGAECIRRTGGGMNLYACWILAASDYISDNRLAAVMTGVGAEAVSGRHWLAEQKAGSRHEALRLLCDQHWAYPRAVRLLREPVRLEARDASHESIRRTLAEAPSEHLVGWADYLGWRQMRRHPTGNILTDDARVLEPFFDIELLDYSYRLPYSMRSCGSLYKKMIIQYFPEMAKIGYTDSGKLLSEEMKENLFAHALRENATRLYYRTARRAARHLHFLRSPELSDNPAHSVYQNTWLRTTCRPFAESLVRKKNLYDDVLDARQVQTLFDDHMSGRVDAYRLLDAVLTFILWREVVG
jgi:asparagine synthetase B (glutamine-hydrolysing)